MSRTFTDAPAVRREVPLFVGMVGSSSSGKTFSALRLATGIQRVTGGEIFIVDTENGRAEMYAENFPGFRHVPFDAPYSPMDYQAAVEHCISRGAKVIVIDSMSHIHEGEGGLLEWHENEVERLSGGNPSKINAVQMLAWSRPKQAQKRFMQTLLKQRVHTIMCFRADNKLEVEKGKEPKKLGWQPIADKRFLYELTVNFLFYPGCKGTPRLLETAGEDERWLVKTPLFFQNLLKTPRQIDEAMGEEMARWARGAVPEHPLVAQYRACISTATLDTLEAERKALWQAASAADKRALKQAAEEAHERLTVAPETPTEEPAPVT